LRQLLAYCGILATCAIALKLLQPWLTYPRILAGAVVIMAIGSVVKFNAATRALRLTGQEAPERRRRLVTQAWFLAAMTLAWLLIGRYLLKFW
jgi:hypothetical protein